VDQAIDNGRAHHQDYGEKVNGFSNEVWIKHFIDQMDYFEIPRRQPFYVSSVFDQVDEIPDAQNC
jgi:hypothetical protein